MKKSYHYSAKNSLGESISGVIEGFSRKEVITLLDAQNLFLIDLHEKKMMVEWFEKERFLGFGKVSFSMISQFAKDLSILLKAGITISEALEMLEKQVRDRRFSKDIHWISEKIRSGYTLSLAMEEKKYSFPELFVFFVKTGEKGGNLSEMLQVSADYYSRVQENQLKMKEILFYPILLMMTSVGVIFFLLMVVLPQFVQLFDSIEQELPWATIFLINTSRFLIDYGIYFLLGIISVMIAIFIFKDNIFLKKTMDTIKMKIPIYGKLKQWEFMMMVSKTMGILLNSGVDLLTVMRGLEAITPNSLFKEAVMRLEKGVFEGKSLTEAMEETGVFQETFVQFTKVGESTGSIGEMMGLSAQFYESQYHHGINMLKMMIEPLLILVLGAIVLFVLLAIMLPVFDLYLFYSSM